ncbi:unnamed protein product [Musa acuminata subsp. malaccensis]|uniref:(wild Malaysian banana) hypothetical protein n=1 Tax=Musa acuminata subsp. malaccensis TaxID=214687 RepID=A0A804IMX8_MUSAM|nr:PREDICTED: uncharacterized protein LOC103981036 [Musa acuminata subsp. malaccensis]CAG1841695.1 unnamed protein product [Musa acuminata subsp. malaccensis]
MTTMEHLFMQIFDRKAWIEGQMRQQAGSYGQSLAYNLLADGGRPPPWLWNAGLDAPGCAAPGELSKEQLIEEILFPVPWATTPSTNHNTLYTLPAFKSTNMSQYSSYISDICIPSEQIYPEHTCGTITNGHRKDDKGDYDMISSKVVEDSSVFDLLANAQCYRSRQRNLENHPNEKSNAENFRDGSIAEQSLACNKVGDGAVPSRMTTKRVDCLGNISEPSSHSELINNKATANRAILRLTMSQKADNLVVSTAHDASVLGCYTGAVGKECAPDGSNFIDPGLRTTPSASSRLSHDQSLVVMKKISFDGIEVCSPDGNPYDSFSQIENLCCSSEDAFKKFQSVRLSIEDSLCKDPVPSSGTVQPEEDALHAKVIKSAEVGVSDSTAKERIEFECYLPSASYNMLHKKLRNGETNSSSLSSAPSHTSCTSMLRSCLYSSGIQGSLSGNLIEQSEKQQSGETKTSRQASIASTKRPRTISYVKPMPDLSENIKPCDITKDSITSERETTGHHAEVSFSESLQYTKDEESHRNSKSMLISSGKKQLQLDNIVPAAEVMREEYTKDSGKSHVEGRYELLNMVETVKSKLCGEISSHVSAMEPLEMEFTTDSCKEQPDGSLAVHKMKGTFKGKLIERSVCNLVQLTHDVQIGSSVSRTGNVCLETEEAEFVTVSGSTLNVDTTESDYAGLGSQLLRSSAGIFDDSGSDGMEPLCSEDHHMALSAKESVFYTTNRDVSEEILIEKSPDVAEMENKLTKSIRSSIRTIQDVNLYEENAYISPSLGKTLVSETKKDENCESVMDTKEKTINQLPYIDSNQNHSSGPQYLTRSLKRHGKTFCYSELNRTSNETSSKQLRRLMTNACEISWPKRRKLNCFSDRILTTPRIRFHQLQYTQEDTCCSSKRSSQITPFEEMQISPSPSGTLLNSDTADADRRSHSEVYHQSKKQCVREDILCLKNKDQIMDVSLPIQHTKGVHSSNLADRNSTTCVLNEIGDFEFTLSQLKEPGTFGDDSDKRLNHVVSKGYCYDIQSVEEKEVFDAEKSLSTYGASLLPNYQDDVVDCDDSMPEFEGFSVGVSPIKRNDICYDSNYLYFREEHVSLDSKQGCSTDLVTPKTRPFENYKINKIADVFQSLPNGLLEQMNLNYSLSGDYSGQYRTSEHDKMSGLCCSLGSVFDCSFDERSYSHSTPSGARFGWAAHKAPLTPPIEKSSLRKISGKSGASSQTVGTNPELVCFRIDENSSTMEDILDKSGTSKEGTRSRGFKVLDNREPLKDVTSKYENAPTLVPPTKMLLDRRDLELGCAYTVDTDQIGDKENQCPSINGNKEGKAVKFLCSRSSKPEINVKTVDGNRSQASTRKGCKPNNIISNISSFIPMVRKKQQATATKGKKDIKVKALEAAEAAKRLEEKKQNAREMRKAASKLERERLEQEKQLKQKQLEEEKRRKAADIAARKRQREEEERKEKERKRRCIEEARKLHREQEERLQAKKEDKGLLSKDVDDDGRKKGLVQEAKQQLKLEKGGVVAGSRKAEEVEPGATKVVISSDDMKGIVQDRMPTTKDNQDFQSYEISPYKDSDDEDGEEENMRRRKYIPSWTRRECLDQLLLSQQHQDPSDIFCRKSSFNLSDVLYLSVVRRQPL